MRVALLLLPLAAGCARPDRAPDAETRRHDPVVIPRYAGPLDSAEARWVRSMSYDPATLPLAWTPAGELIVAHDERYSSHDVRAGTCGGSGLYAVPADGGSARPLATGDPACRAVGGKGIAVAPGAGWAVFSAWAPPNNSVLVRLELATGRTDTLRTGCAAYLEAPAPSPDGRRIAAVGVCRDRRQAHYGLYLLNADGSGLRMIARSPGGQEPPAWSPDGRRIVDGHARREGAPPQLAVMDTGGRVERELGPGGSPAWSPDGRWIAYVADRPGKKDPAVYLVRPDGTDRRLLFRNRARGSYSRGWGPMPEGEPWGPLVWSPDSRHLAFARVFDRGTSVWRVEVATGRVEAMTEPDWRAP